jgi:glucokinase
VDYAIGIDLGGTNIKGYLIDAEGRTTGQAHHPTNDGKGDWKHSVAETVRALKAQCPGPLKGIGLSAPGLPNETNECIAYMPGRLQGLEFFHWGNYLHEKVCVLNDAHAATLAELRFGAAKGLRNAVLLTLGTGVGGGIVIDGNLYQGFFQKAGSLGHMSVEAGSGVMDITNMPGSIEDAIGNCTIEKRSLGRFKSTYDLLQAYKRGDHWATYVWLTSVQKLAVTIAALMNIFSPDAVVLSGGITQAEKDLFEPLNAFLDLYEWRPGGHATPVLKAQHGDMSGALGAASYVFTTL